MKVLQINSVCGFGSTGRIAAELYQAIQLNGGEGLVAFARGRAPAQIPTIRIGAGWEVSLHGALSRLTDRQGFYSRRATERFVKEAGAFQPDLIHLHNLHGYYLHLPTLFHWLKDVGKPVVWTLHDCWAFTGHCAYFDFAACGRWKTGCYDCPQKRVYPASLFADQSKRNYGEKRRLIHSVENMTIAVPSQWLAEKAGQSFLGGYPIQVIPNGINLNAFCPTPGSFREKYGLQQKKIALGVASVWEPRKGLRFLLELPALLGEQWRVVVVGLTQGQMKELPQGVVGITRTNNVAELAEIYTAADVFVNPTLEETMGLVNVEALACGTPVVTFPTGGSPECIDPSCGAVTKEKNSAAIACVLKTMKRVEWTAQNCLNRAAQYDSGACYAEYLRLYQTLAGQTKE